MLNANSVNVSSSGMVSGAFMRFILMSSIPPANPQSVDDTSSSKTRLGRGAIAGLAVACVALLLSAIALCVWYRRRKSSNSGKGKQRNIVLMAY